MHDEVSDDGSEATTMTIEIQRPELVVLLEKRMLEGGYDSMDAMLIDLAYFGIRPDEDWPPAERKPKGLVEVGRMVRGMTEGLDFSRDRSPGRPPIDFNE